MSSKLRAIKCLTVCLQNYTFRDNVSEVSLVVYDVSFSNVSPSEIETEESDEILTEHV